jgi:5-(carboxyamino)imidazole ribonucleotide mutase
VQSKALSGKDSLLSIVQMPGGVPVGTLAIGKPGAINAALLAASVLSLNNSEIEENLEAYRQNQTQSVAEFPVDDD